MANQIFNNVGEITQTSWSGTHGAKRAVVISPHDGLHRSLPVSATYPAITVKPVGTVAVLCQDINAIALLLQTLAGTDVLIQQYFSPDTILADDVPSGPACLVVDLDGKETGGLLLYDQLKAGGWQLPTIMLASNPEIRTVVQLMRAGAEDILLKTCEPGELATAINNALSHSCRRLQHRSRNDEMQRRLEQLTPREAEIVKLVLAGMLNKEIAERLHLALVTVKVHRGSAMRKLGARSAAELARLTLAPNGSGLLNSADSRTESPLTFSPMAAD